MFLLLVIIVSIFSSLHSNQVIETFYDKSGRLISLERIIDPRVFADAQPIFTAALIKAYENLSDEELHYDNSRSRVERYDAVFKDYELVPFSSDETKDFFVIGAFFEGQLIGYISCDKLNDQGEMYVRQLVLNPHFWNNGIGRKLTFAPLQLFPEVSCFGLVTRRANKVARAFYKNISFVECDDYVHEPWSPKDFIGYKKYIKA